MLLTVVDYGVGNLRSIAKSLEKANSEKNLNYTIKVRSDVKDVRESHKMILPGQGHYVNPRFLKRGSDTIIKGYVTDIITDLTITSALKNKLIIEKSVLLAKPTACEVISASISMISH